jgi:hypothetical protein
MRITFTFVANLIVLVTALCVFEFLLDSKLDFEVIGYVVVILGIFSSIFFLTNVNERKLSLGCDEKTIEIKHFL